LPADLEAHGGLYTLHSHLNHSCTPNVSVRHHDQHTALSRITIVAKRPIAVGEELLVSYVDPAMPVHRRRRELRQWGFGVCMCERCVREERDSDRGVGEQGGLGGLEEELRGGLGLMG
jgi:hypothetical protein